MINVIIGDCRRLHLGRAHQAALVEDEWFTYFRDLRRDCFRYFEEILVGKPLDKGEAYCAVLTCRRRAYRTQEAISRFCWYHVAHGKPFRFSRKSLDQR